MGKTKIKFGTDGWRAIIAKDYTVENVKRVSEATAKWMLQKNMSTVVIGYDCRFGGKMFHRFPKPFSHRNKIFHEKKLIVNSKLGMPSGQRLSGSGFIELLVFGLGPGFGPPVRPQNYRITLDLSCVCHEKYRFHLKFV